jgi:hypothetical protein
MQDAPTTKELIEAVRAFLEEKAMPELKGHTAFHARVAANALAIVERELEQGPKAQSEERARLVQLLGHDEPLDKLNVELAAKIRSGEMGLETMGLRDHLWRTTLAKVAIDQPKYSGFQTALKHRKD